MPRIGAGQNGLLVYDKCCDLQEHVVELLRHLVTNETFNRQQFNKQYSAAPK